MVLFTEPTHMEDGDEDEDQENEKDERDDEECRVERRRVSRNQHHADDTRMTCAKDT